MQNKAHIENKKEIVAYLISRLVTLFFVVVASVFLLQEHFHKIETNKISMLIIVTVIIALVISLITTLHAFWKYIKYGKNT